MSTTNTARAARRLAIVVAIGLGGLTVADVAQAGADGTNASSCGYAGYDNSPGNDISEVAGEFNPGNADGSGSFVAFYCNPTNWD